MFEYKDRHKNMGDSVMIGENDICCIEFVQSNDVKIDDAVIVKLADNKVIYGCCRWRGRVNNREAIGLDSFINTDGNTNGTYNGIKLFECEQEYGYLCGLEKCTKGNIKFQFCNNNAIMCADPPSIINIDNGREVDKKVKLNNKYILDIKWQGMVNHVLCVGCGMKERSNFATGGIFRDKLLFKAEPNKAIFVPATECQLNCILGQHKSLDFDKNGIIKENSICCVETLSNLENNKDINMEKFVLYKKNKIGECNWIGRVNGEEVTGIKSDKKDANSENTVFFKFGLFKNQKYKGFLIKKRNVCFKVISWYFVKENGDLLINIFDKQYKDYDTRLPVDLSNFKDLNLIKISKNEINCLKNLDKTNRMNHLNKLRLNENNLCLVRTSNNQNNPIYGKVMLKEWENGELKFDIRVEDKDNYYTVDQIESVQEDLTEYFISTASLEQLDKGSIIMKYKHYIATYPDYKMCTNFDINNVKINKISKKTADKRLKMRSLKGGKNKMFTFDKKDVEVCSVEKKHKIQQDWKGNLIKAQNISIFNFPQPIKLYNKNLNEKLYYIVWTGLVNKHEAIAIMKDYDCKEFIETENLIKYMMNDEVKIFCYRDLEDLCLGAEIKYNNKEFCGSKILWTCYYMYKEYCIVQDDMKQQIILLSTDDVILTENHSKKIINLGSINETVVECRFNKDDIIVDDNNYYRVLNSESNINKLHVRNISICENNDKDLDILETDSSKLFNNKNKQIVTSEECEPLLYINDKLNIFAIKYGKCELNCNIQCQRKFNDQNCVVLQLIDNDIPVEIKNDCLNDKLIELLKLDDTKMYLSIPSDTFDSQRQNCAIINLMNSRSNPFHEFVKQFQNQTVKLDKEIIELVMKKIEAEEIKIELNKFGDFINYLLDNKHYDIMKIILQHIKKSVDKDDIEILMTICLSTFSSDDDQMELFNLAMNLLNVLHHDGLQYKFSTGEPLLLSMIKKIGKFDSIFENLKVIIGKFPNILKVNQPNDKKETAILYLIRKKNIKLIPLITSFPLNDLTKRMAEIYHNEMEKIFPEFDPEIANFKCIIMKKLRNYLTPIKDHVKSGNFDEVYTNLDLFRNQISSSSCHDVDYKTLCKSINLMLDKYNAEMKEDKMYMNSLKYILSITCNLSNDAKECQDILRRSCLSNLVAYLKKVENSIKPFSIEELIVKPISFILYNISINRNGSKPSDPEFYETLQIYVNKEDMNFQIRLALSMTLIHYSDDRNEYVKSARDFLKSIDTKVMSIKPFEIKEIDLAEDKIRKM